ncbi:RNA polymerase sigma factor [Pirellulales bacterium]|nr:RNA polymerase sigma factor [Pirellulales bacterium]
MTPNELRQELETAHAASYQWSLVCCRGDAQRAAEALQTSYVKVLEQRQRFRGDCAVKTWLFAIIRNTVRETARNESSRRAALLRWAKRDPELTESSSIPPLLEASEQVAEIQSAVGQLSTRQRQIIHLVFYERMTISDAAEVLNISVGSARKHYQRAKERLRETLRDSAPDDHGQSEQRQRA